MAKTRVGSVKDYDYNDNNTQGKSKKDFCVVWPKELNSDLAVDVIIDYATVSDQTFKLSFFTN